MSGYFEGEFEGAGASMVDTREVRASALTAAIVGLYLLSVLSTGRVGAGEFATLFSTYFAGSFALWMVLGLVFIFAHILRQARKSGNESFLGAWFRQAVADRWQRDRFIGLLWPPLMFATLIAAFNAFKQNVLPLAGYGFDPPLAVADRWLFLGYDGWRVTHALFGSPQATMAIDRLYHGWFAPMAIGVILCAFLPASTWRLRTQYLLSYAGVWILLGSVLAFLMPSAGPCFYEQLVGPSPEYAELMAKLRSVAPVTGEELVALRNQAMLLKAHGSGALTLGGGISAMPSVHNGLAVLFPIAAWQIHRGLGIALAIYAVAIWIGSIHLGWHYGLDGVVAAIFTYAIWRVSGRIADRLERPFPARGAAPITA